MAYIKTLKNNEIVGGTDNTDVYPVTSTQAIYSQDSSGNVRTKDGKPEKLEDRLNGLQEKVEGKGLSTNDYTNEEKQKLAGLHNYDDTQVRTLIQQTADNFANYYTKSETYSQSQVDQLLRTQREGQYVPVNALPTASAETMFKIYLVPSSDPQTSNIKDEYITIDNGSEATTRYTWEKIGSTDVDLSGYSTTEEMNAAIAAALQGKQDTLVSGTNIKTINNQSILGSGNITIQGGGSSVQSDWNQTDTEADDYIKNKPSVYTQQQTNEAIEQAKEDVSWSTEEYNITEADGSRFGYVSRPRGRVVYFSSIGVSEIRISPLPHSASTGISFKVIGTPTEDTDNFVQISARGFIIFRTSNRPTIFKAGVTYEVEYTYISHTNLGCVYLESWVGGVSTAAYTGSYNDLSDKPTIPTVPTNVSAFNNDAGYLTQHQSLSDYIQKSQTAGLIKNDGTIDTNTYLTQHQDISGKADKSEMSVTDGTGADADKTTITLKSGTSATVLKSHQSLSGKQDVIDSSHKLSADLVDDTNTANKFTNATEKQTWNGKQDVINDLATIRSGASAGATAYQKPAGGIPKTDLAQGVKDSLDKADTALQEDTLYEKVNNNGYEYVDLGLPSGTLWAKCNVGAVSETDAGNLYAYGSGSTTYNNTYPSGYSGDENPLDLSVDTARQVMGGSWRMPTKEQIEELIANTTVTKDGNNYIFTSNNDISKYIVVPSKIGSTWEFIQNEWQESANFGTILIGSTPIYGLLIGRGTNASAYQMTQYMTATVRGIILPEKTQLKKDLDSKADKVPNATNGNFAGLDANGNLTDSGSKASDFATTQQLPTTMGASGSGHKGGLVPDTPSTAGTTKFLCEDGTWKVVDISGKEDVTGIEAPVNQTDATAPITTLTADVGKYYRIDVPVETLAVTLPAMENVTTTKTIVLYLTGGTTPAVTISSTAPSGGTAPAVHFSDGFAIEAGKTYEVNCLWNGDAWIVASVEIVTNNGE